MTNRLPKSRTRTDALTADERAREKIVTELERNFLVEAGAGSGKTTALVNRMIAHVRAGHPVESLAAVTFTRKAAAELAERFRERLEEERRSATGKGDQEAAVQLDRALEQIDRSFVGTIHAFCGRLLRERPLEAELDPSFVEVSGDDWTVLCDEYWRTWVHRLVAEEDAMMATVKELRVDPALLVGSFRTVVEYQDVTFPMPATKAPDSAQCVKQLRSLIARGMKLRPKTELTDGWDELQQLVWRLSYLDNTGDWDDGLPVFCEAIGAIRKSHFGKILKRWSADKTVQEQVKGLADDFQSLLESDIEPLLECWYEHRYKPVMEVLLRARADFERHRIETGQLGFGDLLSRAAALLARDDAARLELGERYRYLMVDEFQDTDPLQAEVCFLLASDPREGTDWRKVKPRAGGLFVVGEETRSA